MEQLKQLRWLRRFAERPSLNCQYAQGYLFSRPQKAATARLLEYVGTLDCHNLV